MCPTRALTMTLPMVWHPDYSIPQPEGHPFPMGKFTALGRWLTQAEMPHTRPSPAPWRALQSVHEEHYLRALASGHLDARAQRRIGFTCTVELFERCRLETGGTLLAVDLALQRGLACNAAGGTHHAHRDFGSGYCLLNDLAVAARFALDQRDVQRVLIIDLDVHQGDGTAALLAGEPRAFTFSMHCGDNFPARKQHSDLDIALPRGTSDEGYLAELNTVLPWLLDSVSPDLVLYDAGVDVHIDDRLGHLHLTDAGLMARDVAVISACRERNIPTACVIGGGYDRDLTRLAARHATVFRAANTVLEELS